MSCGPGTILDADPGAHRLRCPRCGSESWLPALPLFVVTGASGTGKSTITGPLRTLLPGCLVVEADVILHVAAWLRARVTPSFDTSTASAAEVAGRIAAWVTALLAGSQPPAQPASP